MFDDDKDIIKQKSNKNSRDDIFIYIIIGCILAITKPTYENHLVRWTLYYNEQTSVKKVFGDNLFSEIIDDINKIPQLIGTGLQFKYYNLGLFSIGFVDDKISIGILKIIFII